MFWIYFFILSVVSWYDIRTKRIPNSINSLIAVIGTMHSIAIAGSDWEIYLRSVSCTLLVFLLLLAIAAISNGGLGGGDIKLASALTIPTAALGVEKLVLAWFWVCLATIPVGIAVLSKKITWKSTIPFGPCLAVGYLIALV